LLTDSFCSQNLNIISNVLGRVNSCM